MTRIRVGIILGGMSSEKEVSLNSGRNVFDNLDRERYEPVPVFMNSDGALWILPWQLVSQNTTTDVADRLVGEARRIAYEELARVIDFAFISLHGKYGDDGCIQGLLELLNIPYTGSGVMASALGMDKFMQQKLLEASDIAVPRSLIVGKDEWQQHPGAVRQKIAGHFRPPFVTKPTREGSSVGVTIVRDIACVDGAMEYAFEWDASVLVEEYLDGTEFSCIILERNGVPEVLGVTEIQPQDEFYTYDDKYMPGRCRKFTPPRTIPDEAVAQIRHEVLRAYRALGFRSYGRIDGFVLGGGRVLVTDPNSSSGMAPSSFFFEQAADAGMLPSVIIGTLIEEAVAIHQRKKGPL